MTRKQNRDKEMSPIYMYCTRKGKVEILLKM